MPFILSLLLLFVLGSTGQAQASHSKHRSPRAAKSQKSDDVFSGAKSLDGRVAAYNLELAIAHSTASQYEMELQLADSATQDTQQDRENGADDTKVQADESKASDAKMTAEKTRLDVLAALTQSNKMIRELAKDKRLARNYHFGPKYHFEEAYYAGLSQKVREKIITSPLVANSDVVLPGGVSH